MAGKRNGKPPQDATRIGTIGEVGDKMGAFANMAPPGSLMAISQKHLEWAREQPCYIHPNLGDTAGWAGGTWISLNKELLTRHSDLIKTFLHEVAHVIADHQFGASCKHGYEWRCTCIGLGHDASRTHDYPYLTRTKRGPMPRNVVYACKACGTEIRKARKFKYTPESYTHLGCGGKFHGPL